MQPINYNLDIADPFDQATKGLQLGANISAVRDSKAANQQALQLQQQEMQRKNDLHKKIMEVYDKPNKSASDFIGLAMLLPEKDAESMRKNWDVLSKDARQDTVSKIGEVVSALHAGKPDIAAAKLRQQADAYRNAGDEQKAKVLEAQAGIAEKEPDFTLMDLSFKLAAFPEGKDILENIDQIYATKREDELQTPKLLKARAEAQKAAVDSKFAESNAVMKLQKDGWDISKMQNDMDVSRQNLKIAAMNADISREKNKLQMEALKENNDLKRDSLTLQKQALDERLAAAKQKRDELVNQKASEASYAFSYIDEAISLIDEMFYTNKEGENLPKDSLLTAIGASSFVAGIPGTEAKSMAGKVDQLISSLAAENLDKLKGPMSDRDIIFLKQIASNLERSQDEDLFIEELDKARKGLIKKRNMLNSKYGIPQTTVSNADEIPKNAIPDTPNADVSPDELQRILQMYE
jgi:hypothetical protein